MLKIAIPTYDRYDNFKTLDFLKRNDVSVDTIDIFVANEEQKEKYINSIGENYNFIIGVIGLVEQRNFITDYYDEGQIIISMDDDIEDLIEKDDKPFLEWVDDCINFMNENSVGIVGINPSVNPFFYEQRKNGNPFKIGYYSVVGCFQILRNHKELKLNHIAIEDWERSILYFLKYGNTGRYNNVLIKTKYFSKKGGLSTQRNKDNYNNSLNCLLYKYPNLLKYNYKKLPLDKYNEMPNLVFKKHSVSLNVIELPIIPASEFCVLYSMLENIFFPKKKERNNRRGFPLNHQSITFGYTRARFGTRKNGKLFDLSSHSIKHPEIYEELLRIGNIYCPFKFTSIHINKNVVCPKHTDSKNVGQSMLVSFGDYTGCKIVVGGIEYDTNCNPIIFDGSNIEHWNTDDLEGTKYSLIFFNGELSNNMFIDK